MKKFFNIVSIFIFTLFFSFNVNAKNKAKKSVFASTMDSSAIYTYIYYQKDSFELAIKYSTEIINSKKRKLGFPFLYLFRAESNYALNNYKDAKDDFEFVLKHFIFKINDKTFKNHTEISIAECKLKLDMINLAKLDFNSILKNTSDIYDRAISYAYLDNKDSSLFYIQKLDSMYESKHNLAKLLACPTYKSWRFGDSLYNIFILHNILNEKELALQYLELAFKEGYKKFRYLEVSNDFLEIRKDERFNTLIKKYKELQQLDKS